LIALPVKKHSRHRLAALLAPLLFVASAVAIGPDRKGLEEKSTPDLIQLFSGTEWLDVWRAKLALEARPLSSIPALLELMRDEQRKLQNTADLIYPGAETFYGHGFVVNYELDWLSTRAGWALEETTFQDFGFQAGAVSEAELIAAARAGRVDLPLKDVVPPTAPPDHMTRRLAVARAQEWAKGHLDGWNRFDALVAALRSDSEVRQIRALD
jgi:hypothetical protein